MTVWPTAETHDFRPSLALTAQFGVAISPWFLTLQTPTAPNATVNDLMIISPFILDAKFAITGSMHWSNVWSGAVLIVLALGAAGTSDRVVGHLADMGGLEVADGGATRGAVTVRMLAETLEEATHVIAGTVGTRLADMFADNGGDAPTLRLVWALDEDSGPWLPPWASTG